MQTTNESARLLAVSIDKAAPTPVYAQIAEGIGGLLRAGTLPAGTILPPERALCELYGVSRMTLRDAFDLLEREGLIERQRGRGTFVLPDRMRKQQQEMRSFTEEITTRGGVPSSKVLSFRLLKPGFAAREFFGLPETESVYEIQRVRFSNEVPMALETVQIPAHLCPNLDRFNLSDHSLYRILEEHYGLRLARCIEEISAARPSGLHKKLLKLPRGAPVLVIKRRTYTSNDTPMELTSAAYRADLYTAIVRSVRARKERT